MKKIEGFFYWIIDLLFSERVNNVICWTLLALALLFIAFQTTRYTGLIIITQ